MGYRVRMLRFSKLRTQYYQPLKALGGESAQWRLAAPGRRRVKLSYQFAENFVGEPT